jgi:MFS family permease
MFRELISIFSQYKGLSRSAYVIFIARIVTNMGAFIWPLLTLILSRKIGYSVTEIALLSVMIGLVFLPANIIGGKLADRFSRKKIIIIFDLISVAFFMACAAVEPGNLMTFFFVMAGLFANMEHPAFEALIADSTKPHEREKVYSLSYLGHNLGFMFGAAIGGMLFENYLSLAFVLDGITTLSSTILIILFVKVLNVDDFEESERNEYEDHAEEGVTTFQILKERKSIWIQIVVAMFAAFIYDQWSFVLPLYMEKIYQAEGATYFGLIASFNGLIVIIFTPIMTRVFMKWRELRKVMLGLALYSFSYLILRGAEAYWIFFVMMFAFTLGEIINMLGSAPFISRRAPASHRGRVNSYRSIAYFVGGVGGRVVMGFLIQRYSYATAFSFLSLVGIGTVLLVAYNYRVDQRIFPKLYQIPEEKIDEEIQEEIT